MAIDCKEMDGTKFEVFKTAVNLFHEHSYDSVPVSEIASAMGMAKSSLYYYFPKKDDFLECIYLFFKEHIFDERKTLDELKPIFETGTILDMMLSLLFKFPPKLADIMTKILTIIHQQKYSDEKARIIVKEFIIDEGHRYVKDAFEYAISIGRLAPFNTNWIATVINDTANGEYLRAAADKSHDYGAYVSSTELAVFQHAAIAIKDLKPPINANTDMAHTDQQQE